MRMFSRVALVVAAMLVGVVSQVWAQDAITAKIPFAFVTMDRTQPAGTYEFRLTDRDEAVEFTGPDHNGGILGVMTRLGVPDFTSSQPGRVVFDKVGETYYLSEIWLPGAEGFLVHAERSKHSHTTVKDSTPTRTNQ